MTIELIMYKITNNDNVGSHSSKVRSTNKVGKRTLPGDRANRGGKRAVPVDPALAIAMELASDRPLILDEFFTRNPDLPRTSKCTHNNTITIF
jgi:hypothetical protein